MTTTPNRFRFACLGAVLLIALLLTVPAFQGAQSPTGDSVAVTYSHGALHVTIPYKSMHPGAGELSVEVLDPENKVIAHSERRVDTSEGKGWWQADLALANPMSIDDLAWHRLHYRFVYADKNDAAAESTDSISEILRTPVVHILGQQSYLTGGDAAVRVVVTDSKNEVIAGSSSVRIELLAQKEQPRVLFTGRLNRRGTAEAQFKFPPALTGTFQLRYVADTPIGSTEFTQQVRLQDKASILLTTEKPLYQPGQTIHVRALALDRSNHIATANRKLTFELEDSKGNKVFKKATQTDKFGIASAEFALADEVNLGTYHLRALMDANTAEAAINVERYVLPKFKVAVEFGDKDNKAKRGYRPGDRVTGTVRANYFFGKSVDNAEISLKATGMDVEQFEAGSAQGKTDADGAYHFDFRLPTYFAGRPLTSGVARVLVEATVKDNAGHSETRGEPITVSESPLIVTAIPEGGALIPELDNQVFILTSYPDGSPAPAEIKVRAHGNPDQTAVSDQGGVAVVRIKSDGEAPTLTIDASDKEGNHATAAVPLTLREGMDQILLRTERAVYRAGDRIQLHVFSTKKTGAAYVDIVKEGQTVLTRDLDIVNGQADLTLTATGEMAGTLDFSAYLFGRDARPVGDHRLVFVQPADELKIEAKTEHAVYKPGDEARIRFKVTNGRGEGVQAALGLQVVDEAVFALAEKQPGFAKVFFYLEQEALKPRYEIHSIGMPEIVEPVEEAKVAQRDRAARALFAATEMVNTNKFETEVGRTVPRTKFWEYEQRYRTRFDEQLHKLSPGDLVKGKAKQLDSWGGDLRIEHVQWNSQYYLVRSAGADKRFDTSDDLAAYVMVRSTKVPGRPSGGTLKFDIEHDRGPFNGLAEITGSVTGSTHAGIAGATVTVREITTGKTRTLKTDARGQFRLAGVAPGKYEIAVASGGLQLSPKNIALVVRDRAVVTADFDDVKLDTDIVVQNEFGRRGAMGGARDFRQFEGVMPAPPMHAAARGMAKSESFGRVANTATLVKEKDALSEQPLAPPSADSPAAPHVRSYFPEALYINPEIITDQNGVASITIPLADSITTWRMAMLASTTHGALGSATSSLKVFQDFFVDLDLPVTLTQGDRVSLPVAIYNYSESRGDVSLKLQPEEWFSLVDDNADKSLAVEPGRVGGSQFTIEAKRIGKFKLTLAANMGVNGPADIVVREIEVVPDGRERNVVFNGRLETAIHHELNFPANTIPDSSTVFVRLYPGPLSQVVEGMDAILRMPGGCFEQTSSSTYPNVLALDYMKRIKKLTPEVHAKAEGFIANGYQRLLTFEVPGGGFSWFGNPPANKILTSYGLMEFYDMSKVYDVDPKLIARTQQWLASQQQGDGSWKPDTQFINEGATNRYNKDAVRITAYIAWSLENTGFQGPAVEKAKQFIEQHMGGKNDSYTLAVLANFAVDYAKDRAFIRQAMQLLLDAKVEKDEQAWWTSDETGVYSTGDSASVETTGLAVQALLKWGEASATARKALTYIASKKDASGTWGTTQATIMALRALLLSTEKGSADVRGLVEITLNGKPVDKLTLTPDNNDLLHQFVIKNVDAKSANTVDVRFDGKGGLAYQVVGRYFVPWGEKTPGEAMSINVAYDRTRLAQDDVATATATVKNNMNKVANMVMVDLGIPPGFDLLTEDLQALQEKSAARKTGRLEKFSMTATQAILYFNSIGAGETVTVQFRLHAKYPIRAKNFQSRVYEYYDPAVSAIAKPAQFEVRKK